MHESLYSYCPIDMLHDCHTAMSFWTVFEKLALIMYRHSRWQNTPLAIGPCEDCAPAIICRFPAVLSHHFTMIPFMSYMCPAVYIFHCYQPAVWNILFSSLPHWNLVATYADKHLFKIRSRHCLYKQVSEHVPGIVGQRQAIRTILSNYDDCNGHQTRYLDDVGTGGNTIICCEHMEPIELEHQNCALHYSYWSRYFDTQLRTNGEGGQYFGDCPDKVMKDNPNWRTKVKHHLFFVDYIFHCATYSNLDVSCFDIMHRVHKPSETLSLEEFTKIKDQALSLRTRSFQQRRFCNKSTDLPTEEDEDEIVFN